MQEKKPSPLTPSGRQQHEHRERAISPELKSWIRNAIVPILVKEYIAEHERPISLAPRCETVIKAAASTATATRTGK